MSDVEHHCESKVDFTSTQLCNNKYDGNARVIKQSIYTTQVNSSIM